MDDQGTEMVSFQLVAAAGEARSLAFEALEKAKAGDFDAAAKLMKQSKDAGIKAHHIQTQLLSTEAAHQSLEEYFQPAGERMIEFNKKALAAGGKMGAGG